MTIRFNVPPNWRGHLPQDFVPAVDWIPETSWGAPPEGWYLWINSETGSPVMPPVEYAENPYLYLYVMPYSQTPPMASVTESHQQFSAPVQKKIGRSTKIALGVVGFVITVGVIGLLSSGGDRPTAAVSETTQSPSPSESDVAAQEAEFADLEANLEAEATAAEAEAEAAAEAQAVAEAEARAKEEAEAAANAQAEAEAEASAKAVAESKAAAEAEAKAKEEAEAGTRSQQNALRQAESYLSFMAFSRKGLINQLEFEQYSTKDATWAVDRLDVNWKEQAAKKAEDYLELMSFSRAGLIDQLVFEGFTRDQAKYGVAQTGL